MFIVSLLVQAIEWKMKRGACILHVIRGKYKSIQLLRKYRNNNNNNSYVFWYLERQTSFVEIKILHFIFSPLLRYRYKILSYFNEKRLAYLAIINTFS